MRVVNVHRIETAHRVHVSFTVQGEGPPLVLVHGGFSDHHSNWEFLLPFLSPHYQVYALARRGRGQTSPTSGHSVEDEATDLIALLHQIGPGVFLSGHSYGAHVALAAAAQLPSHVAKLVLYEAPWPHLIPSAFLSTPRDWDAFCGHFFTELLRVPAAEVQALRQSVHWAPILADAPATLHDLRALAAYEFNPEDFAGLPIPTLLQIGAESPRSLYVTDALAAMLPKATIASLPGQAHEAMTTAPELYAESLRSFLR